MYTSPAWCQSKCLFSNSYWLRRECMIIVDSVGCFSYYYLSPLVFTFKVQRLSLRTRESSCEAQIKLLIIDEQECISFNLANNILTKYSSYRTHTPPHLSDSPSERTSTIWGRESMASFSIVIITPISAGLKEHANVYIT